MLFFKRILNFSREGVEKREHRKNQRYTVGNGFPVKATLSLVARDNDGRQVATSRAPMLQDWGGWLTNLSVNGANIQLHPASLAVRGDRCLFKLSLENQVLELDSQIAHFRSYPNYCLCGFSFAFADPLTQKAYLQLLEPVVIGSTLAAVEAKKVRQDSDALTKELYRGEGDAQLTVWRELEGRAIRGFEFRMGEYFVRGSSASPDLEIFAGGEVKDIRKAAFPVPALESAADAAEIRRLFGWVVPNLAKSIPSDLRRYLERFVR